MSHNENEMMKNNTPEPEIDIEGDIIVEGIPIIESNFTPIIESNFTPIIESNFPNQFSQNEEIIVQSDRTFSNQKNQKNQNRHQQLEIDKKKREILNSTNKPQPKRRINNNKNNNNKNNKNNNKNKNKKSVKAEATQNIIDASVAPKRKIASNFLLYFKSIRFPRKTPIQYLKASGIYLYI